MRYNIYMALYSTTTKEDFEKYIKSGRPVLVDFWAAWCAPCVMMAPVLEALAQKNPGADILKVNIEEGDENRELAMQYRVQSIPNMLMFKNGEVVDEYIGVTPSHVLQDAFTSHGS